MRNIRIGVLVVTYNRPEIFEKCISSIFAANKRQQFPVVVLRQKSNSEYDKVLARYRHTINQMIEVDGSGRNVEQNINFNRILGMQTVLEGWECDYVICIEDDAIIKNTAFDFCKLAVSEFCTNPRFRGVNFGSRIPYDKDLEFTYSMLRYGCHGPASLVSKSILKKAKLNNSSVKSGKIAWDGWVESYLKTGFMITPNLSMYMDLGPSGTHTPNFTSDPYFAELQRSFADSNSRCIKIDLLQLKHSWRSDTIRYKRHQDYEFIARHLLNLLKRKALI